MTLKLVQRSGAWHVEGRLLGQRVRRSTKLPASSAYRTLAERERLRIEREILEYGQEKRAPDTTWGQAADDYIRWKRMERRCSPELVRRVDMFRGVWQDVPLTEITPAAITTFTLNEWPHLKPGTVRRYLNTFRAILNYAREQVPGFTGVKVPMPHVADERDLHFDEAQANAFLDWVKAERPDFHGHFVTLIDTGVRLSELLAVRPQDFGDDVLRVRMQTRRGKTKTRDVPLSEEMEAIARSVRGRSPREMVFDNPLERAGSPKRRWDRHRASTVLNGVLREGLRAMGLPDSGDEAMRVHDLRHTFAYLAATAGADIGDLQYLLGHADIKQTMRYRGFIQSRARTYVRRARRAQDVSGQESGQEGAA